jgi:hypothetical protein
VDNLLQLRAALPSFPVETATEVQGHQVACPKSLEKARELGLEPNLLTAQDIHTVRRGAPLFLRGHSVHFRRQQELPSYPATYRRLRLPASQ